MDFFRIMIVKKKGAIEISPEFRGRRSSDLMVRGGKFYAVWDPERNFWSTDEYDVYRMVDEVLWAKAKELREQEDTNIVVHTMESFSSGMLSSWNRYISAIGDNYHPLDTSIIFANDPVDKKNFATKRLPYSLEEGDCSAWEELVGTLYSPEERDKFEWAIGAIVEGDSKEIQKFVVFYGEAGTGKSTILNIIEKLFEGYTAVFDAKALGSSNSAFSTEVFKNNPVVAIQHDGDLSRIEDNTKLNSIVSHEYMTINEKYKTPYTARIDSFLFMGTNSPVKISDSRSGVIRRLIDVQPTGNVFPWDHYKTLMERVEFELGAIAYFCWKKYKRMGKSYYNKYKPVQMMYSTNVFFNFVESYFDELKNPEGISLKRAWVLYKQFCEESNNKPMQMQSFRTEMQSYFDDVVPRTRINGQVVTSLFVGFKKEKLARTTLSTPRTQDDWLIFDKEDSLLDVHLAEQPAQAANSAGNPSRKWINVDTKLRDISTEDLHFVKVPENHIVIDFDLTDESGEKSLDENLKAVSSWVPTYAELSKSGQGIHLHYIYKGDVRQLANEYDSGIEVKTLLGDSSLRRKLTKCNDIPIATLTSGLPIKEKKMLDVRHIQSEKGLRDLIQRNLRKEIHPGTKPSIDFIKKILDDVYEDGLPYDVSDLRPRIIAFANNSTNRPLECLKLVQQMKFKSEEEAPEPKYEDDGRLVFFDVEVYSNLFVVCWKYEGESTTVRMVNPTSNEVEALFSLKLVGFNNRRYDNHILYARYLGYDNEELYNLSQKIINPKDKKQRSLFGEAYGLSYADIYDFSSKKQGLKKFQIELGLHHQELDHPWDEPVPEELWDKVVDYCVNDVVTTEAVFNARRQDFEARKILADLSGLSVNDTTQKHTAKIIFGDDRAPQSKFVYTDLSEMFPGYIYEGGKSSYRGEDPSEGGYVYAEPGMYDNVAVLDIASMHPTSIINLELFGPYTKNFQDLVEARLAIKHWEFDKARKLLDGKLAPYLPRQTDTIVEENGALVDGLAYALKIVINIVYGLTSAKFENPFRDVRNVDNIVAKRGALFMIDLKHAVQEQGYSVVHIKTDSIKIPDATPEIIEFVHEFGRQYGYSFEHEKTYDKFCLVNDAVYIARYGDKWDAVGAQFQHPYVYKSMFSFEPIEFDDLCETKSVTQGAIYIDFEHGRPAVLDVGMHFIGRTGSFIPVKEGGGKLYRVKDEKQYALSGTKGYEWMESEMARALDQEGTPGQSPEIDYSYFNSLVFDALDAIQKQGSYLSLVLDGRMPFDMPADILELAIPGENRHIARMEEKEAEMLKEITGRIKTIKESM